MLVSLFSVHGHDASQWVFFSCRWMMCCRQTAYPTNQCAIVQHIKISSEFVSEEFFFLKILKSSNFIVVNGHFTVHFYAATFLVYGLFAHFRALQSMEN